MLSLIEALGSLLLTVVELLSAWRLYLPLAIGVSIAVLAVWLMPELHIWVSAPAVFGGLAAGVWWELRERDRK